MSVFTITSGSAGCSSGVIQSPTSPPGVGEGATRVFVGVGLFVDRGVKVMVIFGGQVFDGVGVPGGVRDGSGLVKVAVHVPVGVSVSVGEGVGVKVTVIV